MKKVWSPLLIFVGSVFVVVGVFQNCSDVGFSSGKAIGVDKKFICGQSLAGEDEECEVREGYGLVGKLVYLPGVYEDSRLTPKVDILVDELEFAGDIYFSKLMVPTIFFEKGFPYEGDRFKKKDGSVLIEGFAIELNANFAILPDQEPGEYEFALLSDDGAVLDMDLGNGFERIVDGDGDHSTTLTCASRTVTIGADQRIPMRVRYFQGPRTEIALTLLMKKTDGAFGKDPSCGHVSQFDYFYSSLESLLDDRDSPDLVSYGFGQLIQRGWVVPSADAFRQEVQ